jgi:hypothetical protein
MGANTAAQHVEEHTQEAATEEEGEEDGVTTEEVTAGVTTEGRQFLRAICIIDDLGRTVTSYVTAQEVVTEATQETVTTTGGPIPQVQDATEEVKEGPADQRHVTFPYEMRYVPYNLRKRKATRPRGTSSNSKRCKPMF